MDGGCFFISTGAISICKLGHEIKECDGHGITVGTNVELTSCVIRDAGTETHSRSAAARKDWKVKGTKRDGIATVSLGTGLDDCLLDGSRVNGIVSG